MLSQNPNDNRKGRNGKDPKVLSDTPDAIRKRGDRDVLREHKEKIQTTLELQDTQGIFYPPRSWNPTVKGITHEGKFYHRFPKFGMTTEECSKTSYTATGRSIHQGNRTKEGVGLSTEKIGDQSR